MNTLNPKKVLSVFSLIMINLIAVDSLRSLPLGAEYGFSLIFYYILAALVFFIPSALATAELATSWPTTGGVYVWVREAFGKQAGFVIIWIQWIYNAVWYPTICALITATFSYLINPALADNKIYMVCSTLIVFWFCTLINCFGIRISSIFSSVGAIIGTIIPMLIIMALGAAWLYTGKPYHVDFSLHSLMPDLSQISNLTLVVGLIFGLIGIEMSAIHAGEVKNPRRAFPRALLISAVIILITLIFASLAIAIVIPQEQLNILTGLIQAFQAFFDAFNMSWMTPIIVVAIIIGSLTGVAAWIIGPAKGLMVASQDGSLPPIMCKTTRTGVPIIILVLQGIIVTVLSSSYLLMPNISSSYWILTDLTAQLALFSYIGLFAALICLRFKNTGNADCYRIPGGKLGLYLTGGVGIIACVVAILLGFIPPSQLDVGGTFNYDAILITGIIIFILPAWILPKLAKAKR